MATSAEIRSQLVAALQSDLIGPSWDDVARRHEQLPQPPSVWFTTGFLVPHVFQQEAGRTTTDEQLSFSDLAGEEPSSDATHRLEKQKRTTTPTMPLIRPTPAAAGLPPPAA
jgi:hypothetical protein